MKIGLPTLLLGGAVAYLWYKQKQAQEQAYTAQQVVASTTPAEYVDEDIATTMKEEEIAAPPEDLAGLTGIHRAVALGSLGNIHSRPWWRDQVTRRLPPRRFARF